MPKNVLLAPPEEVMVRCDNLVKIYKSDEVEVMALQGLDLTVNRGELMGIVGTSGSGKSTLLNMLGGLDRPSAGSLFIDGKDMLKFSDSELISYMRDTVGFVWQNNARNLIPYFSAVQNVELPMQLKGAGRHGAKHRRERAEYLLDAVGLSHRKNSMLGQMSGGEQQRVAIAIALANNPKMLLADEPTGAVDTKTAAMVLEVFRKLNRETGVTIIIVTHDAKLAKAIDRVVSIRDGKTSTETVRRRSALGDIKNLSDSSGAESKQETEDSREELVMLDRAGRLQLPKEYLSALKLKGGDRVRVELGEDRVEIFSAAPKENTQDDRRKKPGSDNSGK